MSLTPNLRASLFMAVSMAGFTTNDAITKAIIETIPHGQAMLVRGAFATILIAILAWSRGALRAPSQLLHPMVALRSTCELLSTVCFLAALSQMPLANLSAILQALPLAVTMGAALFMGETVGWRRWLAISVGFAGVMIIVRPGFDGFNAFALLGLAAVVFAAIRDLATRSMPAEMPSLLVSTATAGIVAAAGAVLMVPQGGWAPITIGQTALLALAAVLLLFGYQFIIMAMRLGEVSHVAPFRYTALIWALLLGYLAFGEVPDAAMIAGSTIIVASGLYTLYRETRAGRHRPAAQSTTPGMAPDGL